MRRFQLNLLIDMTSQILIPCYSKHFYRKFLNTEIFQATIHATQAFSYDSLRRESYTRLESDAHSIGHSLSPNHQVCSIRLYKCFL